MEAITLKDIIKWLTAHQWVAAVALLLGALLLAWLVDHLSRRLLKGLARLHTSKLDQLAYTHLRQPVQVTAFLLVDLVGAKLFLAYHPPCLSSLALPPAWRSHLDNPMH
ncbi:hypothetical protein DFAR_2730006 [Desulfarculales bacterium]